MKKLWVAILMLGLLLAAPVPGYCYTNTVAQKTSNDISEYYSSLQVGLSPAIKGTIAGGAMLGSGLFAVGGSYFIICVPLECLRSSTITIGGGLVIHAMKAHSDYFEDLAKNHLLENYMAYGTWRLYVTPIVLIFLIVTASALYLIWSAS